MIRLFGLVSAIAILAAPVVAHAEDIVTAGQVRGVGTAKMLDPKVSPAANLYARVKSANAWMAQIQKSNEDAREAAMTWTIGGAPMSLSDSAMEKAQAEQTIRARGFALAGIQPEIVKPIPIDSKPILERKSGTFDGPACNGITGGC